MTLAFLTDIIVSCVVCKIPDDVNSASPLESDTPTTLLLTRESLSLNNFVPVLNLRLPATFGASITVSYTHLRAHETRGNLV